MRKLIIVFIFFSTGIINSFAMTRALNTAATGMLAQETNVSTISHNIANVNTIGYKRQRTEFETLLYETLKEPGARTSSDVGHNVGIQIGGGSKVSAIRREFASGSPNITNNPFDLMIKGEGFFGISMPDQSVLYTRDGAFGVDNQGRIVTKKGHLLLPGLTIPTGTHNVDISTNGQVNAYIKGRVGAINVGSIPIFTFSNVGGLKALGGNLYRTTVASGSAVETVAGGTQSGEILQGTLETSNVSIMFEMTNLIRAQRAYEMNSKVMRVADEMMQTMNNIR